MAEEAVKLMIKSESVEMKWIISLFGEIILDE